MNVRVRRKGHASRCVDPLDHAMARDKGVPQRVDHLHHHRSSHSAITLVPAGH